MCLRIPGQIVEIVDAQNRIGKADVAGVTRTIHLGLLEPNEMKVGTWVLIHAGMAVSAMDADQAASVLEFISELGKQLEEGQ